MIAPPIPPQRQSIPHLAALTGLRGLAAWLVVLFHTRRSVVEWMPETALAIIGKGYLAVDLFFMLSGFVLWLNYGQRLQAGGLSDAPHFWWRRIARIWPLHMLVLAGVITFALVVWATGRDMENYPFSELWMHILLVQNWGFTADLKWNHPAWSISTEMAAYLLFPLAVLAVRWEKLKPATLVACIVLFALVLNFVFEFAGEDALGEDIPGLGLERCLAQFAIGMALANLWRAWQGKSGAPLLCAIVSAILFGSLMLPGKLETLLVPLAFAAGLLAIALDTGSISRLLSSRPLLWLGDASYATYITHFPMFVALKLFFVGEDLQIGPALLCGYLLTVLLLSGALYRWFEKPAQRWMNDRMPFSRPSAVHAE